MWFKYFLCCALVISLPCFSEIKEQRKPFIVMLIGAPGSGRNTLAMRITSAFSLPYISCAELVLNLTNEDTPIGKQARKHLSQGDPTPDELMFQLLYERIRKGDCKAGFYLHGFPNTIEQAERFRNDLKNHYEFVPIYIKASEDWIVSQQNSRVICTLCGNVYYRENSRENSIEILQECVRCHSPLKQRIDDQREIIRGDIISYKTAITPLVDYYEKEKLLIEVDGDKSLQEIFESIKKLLF